MSSNPYAPPTAKVADVHTADVHTQSMTPKQELKYLKSVLKQIDHGVPTVLRSRLIKVGVWLLSVALLILIARFNELVSLGFTVGICFFVGSLVGFYITLHLAAKQWPLIRPHISRESVVERINELSR